MKQFISNQLNNLPQSIISIIFIIICLAFIMGIIMFFILISKGKILLNLKAIKTKDNTLNKDFLLQDIEEKTEQITTLENTIIRKQIKIVKKKRKRLHELILKTQRHLLQSKGIDPEKSDNHIQIKLIDLLIKNMINELLDKFAEEFEYINKEFVKRENVNNDFNFIKGNFEEYVIDVINDIFNEGHAIISKTWIEIRGFKFSRRDGWKALQENLKEKDNEIIKILKKIFIDAIKLKLTTKKEIEKLKIIIIENKKKIKNEYKT